MVQERSPFICVRCCTFTAELHCEYRECDWLVCSACESVISDADHRSIATRERFLRERYGNHPSTGV